MVCFDRGLCVCLSSAAGVDIQSQEAYELACGGLLRPAAENQPAFSGPVIYDIRCVHFRPPHFTLGTSTPDVSQTITDTHTHTHPFNGPFSGTTRVSRYQKGKTNLDFAEAKRQ